MQEPGATGQRTGGVDPVDPVLVEGRPRRGSPAWPGRCGFRPMGGSHRALRQTNDFEIELGAPIGQPRRITGPNTMEFREAISGNAGSPVKFEATDHHWMKIDMKEIRTPGRRGGNF